MTDDYRYIDPDYVYTDPKTGILRNLAGVTDHDALTFAETAATAKRANELKIKPISVVNSSTLLVIHHHLFQDLYDWASKCRTVEISKIGSYRLPI